MNEMAVNKCLYCYKELNEADFNSPAGKSGYHPGCSKKFFGKPIPPELPYSQADLLSLAERIVKSHKTVTGVQPKLLLNLDKAERKDAPQRFTLVGLWGEFILKPQTQHYKNLPELEDLTMHLAQISRIKTVDHALIYLKSGQLAYITRRVDRVRKRKFHMEDMCQLTERLTEHKYQGSYEQIAKAILRYSANPGLDVINFYEQVLFSFLTSNNDMHLKNFSLLKDKALHYNLCPAYDLVASGLVVEGDDEELALTLNGKKKELSRADFEMAMSRARIDPKTISNIFTRFLKVRKKWPEKIESSFLPGDLKETYLEMVDQKFNQLYL